MKTLKIKLVQLSLTTAISAFTGCLAQADSLYQFQKMTCIGFYDPGVYSPAFSHIYLELKNSQHSITDLLGQTRNLPLSWAYAFGSSDAEAVATFKNPLSQISPDVFSPGLTESTNTGKRMIFRKDRYTGITSLTLTLDSSDAQMDYLSGSYFKPSLNETYQIRCQATR